jgi:hypothetical protein
MDHLESYKVQVTHDDFDERTPVTGSGVAGLTVAQTRPVRSCELSPGDPSPIGRCPETGDLVYLDRPQDRIRRHAQAMHDLLVEMLTPGSTRATILDDASKLISKIGAQVSATDPSAVTTLLANHVFSYQTDFLESLAAETSEDGNPHGVPSVIQKARALTTPRFDYEGAAIAEGWSIGPDDSEDGTFGYEAQGRIARGISSRAEAARICCELNGIVASPIPTEHWSVSPVLAAILSSRGENVDLSFPGRPIWARNASGHLKRDPILIAIAKEF